MKRNLFNLLIQVAIFYGILTRRRKAVVFYEKWQLAIKNKMYFKQYSFFYCFRFSTLYRLQIQQKLII